MICNIKLSLPLCLMLAVVVVAPGCSGESSDTETTEVSGALPTSEVVPRLDSETLAKLQEMYAAERDVLACNSAMPHPHQTPGEIWAATQEGSGEFAGVYRNLFTVGICLATEPLGSEQRNLQEAETEALIERAMANMGIETGTSACEYHYLGRACIEMVKLRVAWGLIDAFSVTGPAVAALESDLDDFYSSAAHRNVLLSDAVLLSLMRRSEVPAQSVDALKTEMMRDPKSWWRVSS